MQKLSRSAGMTAATITFFGVFNIAGRIIANVPFLRMLEENICSSYYKRPNPSVMGPGGTVKEEYCKVSAVQTQMATLVAWTGFLQDIFGLVAVPFYIYLAQHWCRRGLACVELLCWFGGCCAKYAICYFSNTFNVNLLPITSLSSLIGGSPGFAFSLISSILAEKVPASSLSNYLVYISGCYFAARVIAFSLAARMMQSNPRLSVLVGLIIVAISVPLLALIDEDPKHRSPDESMSWLLASDDDRSEEFEIDETTEPSCYRSTTLKPSRHDAGLIRRVLHNIWHAQKQIITHLPISVDYLVVFLLHRAGEGVMSHLSQWSSAILHWTLAETNYVHSFIDFVGGATLYALPSIKNFALRRGFTKLASDLSVTKLSLLAIILGNLCIGLSGSKTTYLLGVVVYKLGVGFDASLTAHVRALGREDQIMNICMSIAVVENVASILSGPMWAAILNLGLRASGWFTHIPFWVSLCLMGSARVILSMAKPRKVHEDGSVEDEVSSEVMTNDSSVGSST